MLLFEKSRGFSLVELLMAVAITGVLLSVAVPQYLSYRARAAQAEAKTHLGFIGKAERAYFAEWSTFTDNLLLLNLSISGSPRYLYGFTTDAVPAPSARNDTAELRASREGGDYSTARMVDAFGVLLVESDLPEAAAAPSAFRVGAVGNADSDPALDRWTVDENGVLLNVTNDVDDEI